METLIGIVTVSDSRSAGLNEDLSGPACEEALRGLGYGSFEKRVVPDEISAIQKALVKLSQKCHIVFTTGGTGFSPRDVTPEATAFVLEKRADNIVELIRLKGLEKTPFSHLSRGIAGTRGTCLIVNLPGAPKAVKEGIEAVGHLLKPIVEALMGKDCSAHNEA